MNLQVKLNVLTCNLHLVEWRIRKLQNLHFVRIFVFPFNLKLLSKLL